MRAELSASAMAMAIGAVAEKVNEQAAARFHRRIGGAGRGGAARGWSAAEELQASENGGGGFRARARCGVLRGRVEEEEEQREGRGTLVPYL